LLRLPFFFFSSALPKSHGGTACGSSIEGDDGGMDLQCTLAPGLRFLFFLRANALKGNVFFDNRMQGPDVGAPPSSCST